MSKHTPRNLAHALVRKSNSPPMPNETLVGGSLALLLASALAGALSGAGEASARSTGPNASAVDLRRGAGLWRPASCSTARSSIFAGITRTARCSSRPSPAH